MAKTVGALVAAAILAAAGQEALIIEKVDALSAENRYDDALELCTGAEKTLIKLKDGEAAFKVREKKKEIEGLKKEYAKVKEADAKCAVAPADEEANLVMGRFYAFVRDDWGRAIPMLAKGNDPFLRALAEAETKVGPTLNGPKKLAIGESWWTGSQDIEAKLLTGATATFKVSVDKETVKKAKGKMKTRALWWFSEAWDLVEDADRERLRPRFKNALVNPAAGPERKGPVEGWDPMDILSVSDRSSSYVRSGRYSLHGGPNPKGDLHLKMSAKIRLIPGKKYELSAWFLTDGKAQGSLWLAEKDADGGLFQPMLTIKPDRPFWSKGRLEFTCPKGISDTAFRLEVTGKNAQVWVDDVSLACEGKEIIVNGGFENPK